MGSDIPWAAEQRARLREMWAQPELSAQQIAAALGRTKWGVINVAHRMGLPARPSPIRRAEPDGLPPTPAQQARLDAGPAPLPPFHPIAAAALASARWRAW